MFGHSPLKFWFDIWNINMYRHRRANESATFPFQDRCGAVAIMKIKESMQEEAKRFEKPNGSTDRPSDFFVQ